MNIKTYSRQNHQVRRITVVSPTPELHWHVNCSLSLSLSLFTSQN